MGPWRLMVGFGFLVLSPGPPDAVGAEGARLVGPFPKDVGRGFHDWVTRVGIRVRL